MRSLDVYVADWARLILIIKYTKGLSCFDETNICFRLNSGHLLDFHIPKLSSFSISLNTSPKVQPYKVVISPADLRGTFSDTDSEIA